MTCNCEGWARRPGTDVNGHHETCALVRPEPLVTRLQKMAFSFRVSGATVVASLFEEAVAEIFRLQDSNLPRSH